MILQAVSTITEKQPLQPSNGELQEIMKDDILNAIAELKTGLLQKSKITALDDENDPETGIDTD